MWHRCQKIRIFCHRDENLTSHILSLFVPRHIHSPAFTNSNMLSLRSGSISSSNVALDVLQLLHLQDVHPAPHYNKRTTLRGICERDTSPTSPPLKSPVYLPTHRFLGQLPAWPLLAQMACYLPKIIDGTSHLLTSPLDCLYLGPVSSLPWPSWWRNKLGNVCIA
jgi:hypothetical protein